MNIIPQPIREIATKKWPGLEVPILTPGLFTLGLVLAGIQIAYGFYTFQHEPHAEKFLMMLLIPLFLLIIRHRLFLFTLLISGTICTSFLAIGAPETMTKAVIIGALFLFIFHDVRYSYMLGIMSLYLFVVPSFQGFSFTHSVFVLAFSAYLFNKISVHSQRIFQPTGYTRYLSFFYLWAAMTLFWCQYLPFGIYDLFIYLSLYIIFLLGVSLIQEEKQLLPIAWTWVIMACIYSIIKPIIPAGGSDATQVMGQGPSTSLFSDKNNISSLINMSLFMLMAIFILDKKGSHRLFLVLAAILMLNVDYIFGSRRGLVSLGFGVLLFMLVLNRRRKKWKKFALTAITVITIVALIIIIPVVPLLFYKLGETVQIDLSSIQVGGASGVSLDFRFDQWGYASHMLNDKGNHLTGLGLAGYKSLYSEYYNPDITPIATNNPMLYAHPHSYWVYTYTDMGIIGMIILHIFFIVFIWNMRKFLLTTENLTLIVFGTTIFCGVITYWVHGVVEFSYTESNRMWLFIGMGSALILINEREKQLTSVRAPERLEEGVPV